MKKRFLSHCIKLFLIIFVIPSAYPEQEEDFTMNQFLGFNLKDERELFRENPKTLFQTNIPYDERIALPVDGVILHRHGAKPEDISQALKSWQEKGFITQRMFFADSDAGWVYCKGGFDGKEHPEDIELDQAGNQVLCGGDRPYMVPTKSWIEYLKTQAKFGMDAGAQAILPEEPLAHKFTGYEESFKKIYEEEYGIKWRPPHESPDAYFKTCRLKNKLYISLEQELQKYCREYTATKNRGVDFLIPIHSMYSNLSASLVAPLGTSLSISGHRGYIGQIWTGPVLWSLDNYSDKEMTFFEASYMLYDYFVNMVLDTELKLYLLTDPVEDHPGRSWPDYEKWFKECVAAELLFGEIDTYEVMPWPDRIFLPGYQTGGGTPGPAPYRTIIMSVLTALQDMPKVKNAIQGGTHGIGMLIGDTAMWQHGNGKVMDPFLSLLAPLLRQGIPVSSVPVERVHDSLYMKRFQVLILSYDGWKPEKEQYHEDLARWVNAGGMLVIFDGKDSFDDLDMFWKKQGFPNPQAHLLKRLGVEYEKIKIKNTKEIIPWFSKACGDGHVIVCRLSPETLAKDPMKKEAYVRLLKDLVKNYLGQEMMTPGYLSIRRGNFLIAHGFSEKKNINGRFIDIFSSDLRILKDPVMEQNSSMILYDISEMLRSKTPRVLYSTYRLMGKKEEARETAFLIQGPTGVEGKARIFTAGREAEKIVGMTRDGKNIPIATTWDNEQTMLIGFPYEAQGEGIKITWR